MPQLQVATPRQGSFLPGETRETLQSCMKPTPVHKSSASQVRFSLPPRASEGRIEHSAEVAMDAGANSYTRNHERRVFNKAKVASSTPKIVYPRSGSGEVNVQIIDVLDNVTDPVPKRVWDFRKPTTTRRGQDGHSRSHSIAGASNVIEMPEIKPRSHLRSRSLQSVTFETINSYVPPSAAPLPPLSKLGQVSNNSSVSILHLSANPHNQSKQLYIRPESPLNKSKVPIPLEIHVPPLFSPEKMHKRASALLDDGDGYGAYHEDSSTPITSEDPDRSEASADSSDGSIILAVNDASMDLSKENLNDVLGTEETNLNFKKQARNISNRSPFRGKPRRTASPHMEVLQEARVAVSQTNNESPCSEARLRGLRRNNLKPVGPLEILSTPTKLITIPAFENEPAPKGRNVLSGFFSLEDEQTRHETSPSIPRDRLDESFKFPRSKVEHNNETGDSTKGVPLHSSSPRVEAASDFLRVPEPRWEASIESRRSLLQRENILGHHHRRSRSIHTADDMFNPGYPGTPPKKNPIADSPYLEHFNRSRLSRSNFRIPERSPLRPKSMLVDAAPKIEPLLERARDDLLVASNTIVPDVHISPVVDVIKTPEKGKRDASSQSCPRNDVHNKDESKAEDKEVEEMKIAKDFQSELLEQGKSGTPSKPFIKVTSREDGIVSSSPIASSTETTYLEDGDTSVSTNLNDTPNALKLGKSLQTPETAKSAHRKLSPLSSARETFHPPHLLSRVRKVSSDPHVNHVIKQKVNNRLDPKRSLSNGLSNSSYDSDFSTPSCQPSVGTNMSGTVSKIDSICVSVKNVQILDRSEDQFLTHNLVPFSANNVMDPLSDNEEEDVVVKYSANTDSTVRTPEKSIKTECSRSTESTVGPKVSKQSNLGSSELEATNTESHFTRSKKADNKMPTLINDTTASSSTITNHSTNKDLTSQGNKNKKKGWSPKRFAKLRSKSLSWLEKRFYRFKKPL